MAEAAASSSRPPTSILPDVPPANVIAMYDGALEAAAYR